LEPQLLARYISFAVLFAILILIGVLFYKVMVGFFIPVFIAVVLVVVFQPLHRWVLKKVKNRPHLAATLTTSLIAGSVLIPTAVILTLATVQGIRLLEDLNESNIRIGLSRFRSNPYINLESPVANELRSIDAKVHEIQDVVSSATNYADVTDPRGRMAGDIADIQNRLQEIPDAILEFYQAKAQQVKGGSSALENEQKLAIDALFNSISQETLNLCNNHIGRSGSMISQQQSTESSTQPNATSSTPTDSDRDFNEERLVKLREEVGTIKARIDQLDGLPESTLLRIAEAKSAMIDQLVDAQILASKLNQSLNRLTPSEFGNLASLQDAIWQLQNDWNNSSELFLGGRFTSILKNIANPSAEQVKSTIDNAFEYIRPKLLSFGGGSVAFIVKLLVGITILLVSLYFFLVDGPGMIRSLMELSPLDDRYEAELLTEFDQTSRAIVLATILSAVAQGLTAGLAYFFLGAPSAFLLTALTMVCALIPFVGTAIVWVPAALFMAIYQDRVPHALGLAVYAVLIVGTIDNLIKMLILHGQRQLHPLLALLSVLGGIQALGPIGILIGPLAVTLLQTTLSIFRRELIELNSTASLSGQTPLPSISSASDSPASDSPASINPAGSNPASNAPAENQS
jgi:predicted PurR-regulated permease PerM